MASEPTFLGVDTYKLVAGVAGAVASLRFVKGTITQKFFMVVGGAALSYFGTTPLALWANAPQVDGLLGFMIGLLGMSLVSKLFDILDSLDAVVLGQDGWKWVKRRIGIGE